MQKEIKLDLPEDSLIRALLRPYVNKLRESKYPLILAKGHGGIKLSLEGDMNILRVKATRLGGEDAVAIPVTEYIWVWCHDPWPSDIGFVSKGRIAPDQARQMAERKDYCLNTTAFNLELQFRLEMMLSGRKFSEEPHHEIDYKIGGQEYTVDNLSPNVYVQRAIKNGQDLGRWRLIKRIPIERYLESHPNDPTAHLISNSKQLENRLHGELYTYNYPDLIITL